MSLPKMRMGRIANMASESEVEEEKKVIGVTKSLKQINTDLMDIDNRQTSIRGSL